MMESWSKDERKVKGKINGSWFIRSLQHSQITGGNFLKVSSGILLFPSFEYDRSPNVLLTA